MGGIPHQKRLALNPRAAICVKTPFVAEPWIITTAAKRGGREGEVSVDGSKEEPLQARKMELGKAENGN